jgi:glycosyltransferase involved in cell wall biosynthesis
LVDDPELRRSSGIAGRKHVKKIHSSEVVIEQIMDVYKIAMDEAG